MLSVTQVRPTAPLAVPAAVGHGSPLVGTVVGHFDIGGGEAALEVELYTATGRRLRGTAVVDDPNT